MKYMIIALASLFLSGCATKPTYVAVKQQEAVIPPHLNVPPKKPGPRSGASRLDKHLRREAKELKQAGDNADTLRDLQKFHEDTRKPPEPKEG